MKKWTAPAVAELNVEETANGFWCGKKECGWFLLGTHAHGCSDETHNPDDSYEDNKEVVNENS